MTDKDAKAFKAVFWILLVAILVVGPFAPALGGILAVIWLGWFFVLLVQDYPGSGGPPPGHQ